MIKALDFHDSGFVKFTEIHPDVQAEIIDALLTGNYGHIEEFRFITTHPIEFYGPGIPELMANATRIPSKGPAKRKRW